MISRFQNPFIKKAWKQFPIVVLTGARQVGKTTLARQILPKANYVSLDSPAEAELAKENAAAFFEQHPVPLILDEAQYAPNVFRQLKILADSDRRPGQFFVTGSQSFELMAGVTESLAGRCAVLALPGLTLSEVASSCEATVDDFLWRGSFPELWQRPELERELWLGSYVATYLERDVRNVLRVGNLRDFDRLLRALALRAGQMLSLSDLARDVGVSPNTVASWVSVLEASNQIFLLEPYFRHRSKRLIKAPKIYFCDTGMLTFLMGFRKKEEVFRNAHWGAIWENFVVSEMRKSFLVRGVRPPLWYWRTSDGHEIDLLVEAAPEQFFVVECKTGAQIDAVALKSVPVFAREYGEESVRKTFVACRTDKAYPISGYNAEAVPLLGRGGLLERKEIFE